MFSVDPIPCMRFWALKKMSCSTARDVVHLCPPTKRKEKESKEVWCVNNFHSYLVIPTACSLLFNDFQYVHVVSYCFSSYYSLDWARPQSVSLLELPYPVRPGISLSTHQCTIQWKPVMSQLWMNCNLTTTELSKFHLRNQSCTSSCFHLALPG